MTDHLDVQAVTPVAARGRLLRWFISSATLSVPQAAGPVAFSLLALQLEGATSGGAAMILAMTIAQVAGAVPLTRLGSSVTPATALRFLLIFRAIALALMTLSAFWKMPLEVLVGLAAAAGLVNGAAFGYLRTVLNELTPAAKLPRALGIAATLGEATFVLSPVLASALGSVSPLFAVCAMAVLGTLPALLVPSVGAKVQKTGVRSSEPTITPEIMIWLLCSTAGGAAVAAIEIGAVALALEFGHAPALAIMFTVPLCLASVAGGVWVSVRNRGASRAEVILKLLLMSAGSALVATSISVATTIGGAVLMGFVLAPLSTHYSLELDKLAPPSKRAEIFALLRTANAMGVIFASAMMTMSSITTALVATTGLMVCATLLVAVASRRKLGTLRP